MFNFHQTFNVLFLNQEIIDKYFNNLLLIQEGVALKFFREKDTFDSQLKIWIKENIAMNDKYFFGELVNFKFHVSSNSLIKIKISSGNSELYSETQEFDSHTVYLKNFNWSSINTEKEVDIFIKLEDLDIHQENFNFLLKKRNGDFPEEYLKNLFNEILRETQTRKEFISLNFAKFDFITNLKALNSIIKNEESKIHISKFLETLDIYYLLLLLKDNFWKNSNF